MANDRLFENIRHWLPDASAVTGLNGIPSIQGISRVPPVGEWTPFNNLSRTFTKALGVQMYVEDYRLHRLWATPDRYVPILRRAGVVLTPDFSLYTDVPLALNLYNHYRKHWLGAYWQRHGITVLPTIGWAGEDSFAWCFDGEPSHSVVSVSSVGTQRRADTRAAFLRGYDAMLERLQPQSVLFFGKVPDGCRGSICPVEAFYQTVKRRAASADA